MRFIGLHLRELQYAWAAASSPWSPTAPTPWATGAVARVTEPKSLHRELVGRARPVVGAERGSRSFCHPLSRIAPGVLVNRSQALGSMFLVAAGACPADGRA